MKKLTLLFALFIWAKLSISQVGPPYFRNANPTRATNNIGGGIPFGTNATLGARMQCFYPPGFLSAGNANTGLVTLNRIYFFADTTSVDTINYANLNISLGEFSSAPTVGFTWNTAASRLTNVVSGSGVTIVALDTNWFAINFTTPYVYDPSKFLLVDFTVGAQSPFINQWLIKSGPTPGSYISAANAAAATPNTLSGGGMPAIGFDPFTGFNNAAITRPILPPGCTTQQNVMVTVKNAGRNIINSVVVNWRVNGVLQTPTSLSSPIDTFGSAKNDTTFSLGSVNLATGPVTIVAYVSSPNSSVDPDLSNDTLTFEMGASLNGTYTISPSSSTFPTIASAVQALRNFGVCGQVTFKLDTVSFFEQVEILGRINGASANNPIVFEGIDKNKSIIASGSTIVNAKHIVKLQGAAYLVFRNLTVKALSNTHGWGFHLLDSCNRIGIKNCVIDISSAASSITNNNTAGISISGMPTGLCIPGPCATGFTTAARADSLEIDSNLILFGFTGINITGNNTTLMGRFNRIRNNQILYSYQNSINLVGQSDFMVNGNTIFSRQTGAAGVAIFVNGVDQNTVYGKSIIAGNRIQGYATAGISLNNHGGFSANDKSLIANNMIGGMAQLNTGNGIVVTACRNWAIRYNSLHHDAAGITALTSSALRILGATTQMSVLNNIISCSGAGIGIPVHLLLATNVDTMDRNVFYRRDTSTNNQLINIAGTGFSIANFRGASGLNLNSAFVKPDFRNDTSLYLNSVCYLPAAIPTASVPNDIDGMTRSLTTPVVGAHERQSVNNNLALIRLLNPTSPLTPGPKQVIVLVQNLGSNAINSFNIAYRYNGALPVLQPITLSNPLLPCDTQTVVFSVNLLVGTADSIANLLVYSFGPNSFPDTDASNDTLRIKLFTPLNGNYIIGGPNASFANFREATNALMASGVNGAVTFQVSPGTYTEQVDLQGPILGLNASRRIVFEAFDTSNRVLTFAGNVGAPHTFRISNVPYVTLRNLKIQNTGGGAGWAVHITGNSNGVHIKKCAIEIAGAGTSSTATSFMGISASGSTITTANKLDSLEIDSNWINFGYQSINIYGGSAAIGINNKIRNNQILNAQQYSVYLVFQQTPDVLNNTIISRGATAGVGVYCQNVTTVAGSASPVRINGNRISNYGTAGIFLTSCTNLTTLKGQMLNNAVGGLVKLAGSNSIYATSSTHWNICNNSINHDFATTTAATAAAIRLVGSATATQGFSIINNSIAVTGNGIAVPVYTQVLGNIFEMDYNLFFRNDTSSNNVMAFFGANVAANALRGFNNWNRNSLIYRPGYMSANNLFPNPADSFSWSLNGRGVFLPYATTDINGVQRASLTWDGAVDIGAFEFTPTSLAPMARAFPDTAIAYSTQIFTFGFDTVAKITWGASVPGFIAVRQHGGVVPPIVNAASNYMYFHTTISQTLSGSVELYYKDTWKGTHPSEAGIWVQQMDNGAGFWNVFTSSTTIDTVRNILNLPVFITSAAFAHLSGTNGLATSVPVTLSKFAAHKQDQSVLLTWVSASEINSHTYEVQRSMDGKQFFSVGQVSAQGNKLSSTKYNFVDRLEGITVNSNDVIYYRLKMLDKDASFEFSEILSVQWKTALEETKVNVFPNPFTNELQIVSNTSLENQVIGLKLFDYSGKILDERSLEVMAGENAIMLTDLGNFNTGVYILQIYFDGKIETHKLIKN